MMGVRRKKLLLQLSRKMEAIDLINRGKPLSAIAYSYGVGLSTVSNWKKNQYQIRRYCSRLYASNGGKVLDERFTMKTASDNTIDGALFIWYEQALDRGEYITGDILRKKAKEINIKLTGVDNFSASIGWLTRWKKRHGIVGKYTKKPDERALLSLPNIETTEEDPLKLDVDANEQEAKVKRRPSMTVEVVKETQICQKKTYIPKDIPFKPDHHYSPRIPIIKNIDEIISKNSTTEDKQPTRTVSAQTEYEYIPTPRHKFPNGRVSKNSFVLTNTKKIVSRFPFPADSLGTKTVQYGRDVLQNKVINPQPVQESSAKARSSQPLEVFEISDEEEEQTFQSSESNFVCEISDDEEEEMIEEKKHPLILSEGFDGNE